MRPFKFLLGLVMLCAFALTKSTLVTANPWDGGPGVVTLVYEQPIVLNKVQPAAPIYLPIWQRQFIYNYVSAPGSLCGIITLNDRNMSQFTIIAAIASEKQGIQRNSLAKRKVRCLPIKPRPA